MNRNFYLALCALSFMILLGVGIMENLWEPLTTFSMFLIVGYGLGTLARLNKR